MKTLQTLCLAGSFCALIPLTGVAGMAPDYSEDFDSSVQQALESVTRPHVKAQSTPAYSVSLSGPNRIAVEGKKIINAIYDNTQLEVQTDALTGQIFVFPKSEVTSALFLTTEDKSTFALTLLPQNIRSQEIVLRGIKKQKNTNAPYKQKTFAESIEVSPDFETKVTRLIRALARDEVPEGFHATNRCGAFCLKSLTSETLAARVLTHKNTSGQFVTLEEKLFYQKGVLAVAISQANLAPNESTRVYIVSNLEAGVTP
jgi:hypothetical protein